MKKNITFTRGYELRIPIGADEAQIVLVKTGQNFSFSTVEDKTLIITKEDSETVPFGLYQYQILNSDGILQEGVCKVEKNLLLDENDELRWTEILEAIDAQIAGRATAAQQSVTVGDKSIGYCSLNELLRLRDYVADRAAEEMADDENGANMKNDMHVIKYVWR